MGRRDQGPAAELPGRRHACERLRCRTRQARPEPRRRGQIRRISPVGRRPAALCARRLRVPDQEWGGSGRDHRIAWHSQGRSDAARRHRAVPQGREPARREGGLRQLSAIARHDAEGSPPAALRARPFPFGRFRPGRAGWAGAALLAAASVLLPIGMLARLALGGGLDVWPHLIRHVVPDAVAQTAFMLVGVGALVVVIGTSAAWLVSGYEFRGRRVLDWALLLPLAVPTYLVAYAYSDLLHPIGPVQTALRTALGLRRPSDLPLPDIRSLGGAILLLGFVLYPYVYLT